jgi:TRAP-type C4-dicarboxylate transport system permease small subunit
MFVIANRIVKALDKLFHGIAMSVGVAVILTVVVISYGVLAREVLKMSDVWVTDVTTYLMGYMTFVGTATLAWQGRHLKVDVLGHHVGPRTKRALTIVSCLIVTCVSLVLLWLSTHFWMDAWDSNERSWGMLSMPLWIPYLSLFVGSMLLAFAQVLRLAMLLWENIDVIPENSGDRMVGR